MTSGGKEAKDSGYATRGPREKLAQVTEKPTVTLCIILIMGGSSGDVGEATERLENKL